MAEETTSPPEEGIPYKIEHYKCGTHRNIIADGAWLGLNGNGQIIINFWSDSPSLPKTVIAESSKDGLHFLATKQPQVIYFTDAASVRGFEASVFMGLEGAKSLRDGLNTFISLAEDQNKKRLSQ
jgi:hypothetical protein